MKMKARRGFLYCLVGAFVASLSWVVVLSLYANSQPSSSVPAPLGARIIPRHKIIHVEHDYHRAKHSLITELDRAENRPVHGKSPKKEPHLSTEIGNFAYM